MDQHKNILKSLCQVCGEKIPRNAKTWKCEFKRYAIIARKGGGLVTRLMKILAARKTKYHQPAREIHVVTWDPHCEVCKVCQEQSHGKRGRPK